MRPVLQIDHLRIQRGDTLILDDLSWRIDPGQHWVILGPNGCGKTSLLSALTGYFMPTAGSISVFDQCYGESDWRELRRSIGMISTALLQKIEPQEIAINAVISGKYAMINYWGQLETGDRQEAMKRLAQVECESLALRPWLVLSQGERQRVLIARALMATPRLLILDEPCSGLDPVARKHFLQFLQRLGGQPDSPSLVLVTHHVDEIMPIFTHAMVMKNGRILDSGLKQNVLQSKTFSQAFETPMRLSKLGDRYRLSVQVTHNLNTQ